MIPVSREISEFQKLSDVLGWKLMQQGSKPGVCFKDTGVTGRAKMCNRIHQSTVVS